MSQQIPFEEYLCFVNNYITDILDKIDAFLTTDSLQVTNECLYETENFEALDDVETSEFVPILVSFD